jgi:hypothetical protein
VPEAFHQPSDLANKGLLREHERRDTGAAPLVTCLGKAAHPTRRDTEPVEEAHDFGAIATGRRSNENRPQPQQ